jgi:hypothetical protein
MDVVEQGAAGVGDVRRVHGAAGQPPQQEAVDGSEGELAPFGASACTRHVIEDPCDLGRREIGVEQEARSGADQRLDSVRL